MECDDTSITKQILNLVLEANELKIVLGTWTGMLFLILVLNIYIAIRLTFNK